VKIGNAQKNLTTGLALRFQQIKNTHGIAVPPITATKGQFLLVKCSNLNLNA